MAIDGGDWLSFAGSVLGAAGGIGAAYLAVAWQRNSQDKATERTIRALIEKLRATAGDLDATADTGASKAARAVYRAFCSVRDVAIGVRTNNASIATIAARLEHTTVFPELERLVDAPENGIAALDAKARAADIVSLCDELHAYFKSPLSVGH